MPLLPYISDTGESLLRMFSAFSSAGAKYLFPAPLSMYGWGKADSRTLVLRAVEKNYPELTEKYRRFFGEKNEMPEYYVRAFSEKCRELSRRFAIKNSII